MFKEFYARRWAEWKKHAAAYMPQHEIDELEASLDRQSKKQNAIFRAGVHCGLPLVEKGDPFGRSYVHVSCARGYAGCPDHFLVAIEAGYLAEIRASAADEPEST